MTVRSETNIEIPAHHFFGPSVAEHMNAMCLTIYDIPLEKCTNNSWLFRSWPCSELFVGSFLAPTWRLVGTDSRKARFFLVIKNNLLLIHF